MSSRVIIIGGGGNVENAANTIVTELSSGSGALTETERQDTQARIDAIRVQCNLIEAALYG